MLLFAHPIAYGQEECVSPIENSGVYPVVRIYGMDNSKNYSIDSQGNFFIRKAGGRYKGDEFYYFNRATGTYKALFCADTDGQTGLPNCIPDSYNRSSQDRIFGIQGSYLTRNGQHGLIRITENRKPDDDDYTNGNFWVASTHFFYYSVAQERLEKIDLGVICTDYPCTKTVSQVGIPLVHELSISEDGRYIAYTKFTTDLSKESDSFTYRNVSVNLYDRLTGTTTVIKESGSQVEGTYPQVGAFLAPDGDYVYQLWPDPIKWMTSFGEEMSYKISRYHISSGTTEEVASFEFSIQDLLRLYISKNGRYLTFWLKEGADADASLWRIDGETKEVLSKEIDIYARPSAISDEGIIALDRYVGSPSIYDIASDQETVLFNKSEYKYTFPDFAANNSIIFNAPANNSIIAGENNPAGFYEISLDCERPVTGNSAYPYYAFYQDALYNAFNDADGTAGKYTDYTGNQHALTVTGTVTPAPNRFGKDSAAVHIEGLGSRLSLDGGTLNPANGNANANLANASLANTTNARVTTNETDPTLVGRPVTIAVWFKMDDFNYGASANRILDKTGGTLLRDAEGDEPSEGSEYYLNIAYDADNPEPRLHFACMDAIGGLRELISSQEVVTGEWQLVIIEKDENNTLKVHHNGAPVGTLTNARIRGNLEPLDIGGRASEFESWQFEGDIDDLFIQSRVFTDCEKEALWSARPAQLSGTPPLQEDGPLKRIAQYTFTEGSLEDATGNYPATSQGAEAAEDKFGQAEEAMHFEGNSSLTAPIDFDGTRQNYSVSTWFKAESTLTGNLLKIEGEGYEWRLSLEDNQLVFYQNGTCQQSDKGSTRTPEGQPLQAGRWYHLIATFDFESQVKTIYLSDGETDQASTIVISALSDLYIDRMPKGALTIGEAFSGTLDNLQFFGKVLDYCQMRKIFIEEKDIFQHPTDQNRGIEGLVAHYPMIEDRALIQPALDDTPSEMFAEQLDISGNANHMVIFSTGLVATPIEALPGHGFQPGQAIRYLSAISRFTVPSEVASLAQDSAAISMWFKPTELGFTQTLLDKTDGLGDEGSEYRLQIRPDGRLRLTYFTEYIEGECGGYEEMLSETPISVNEWHHLVVIKSHNKLRWYLDNTPAGEDISVYLSKENSKPAVLGAAVPPGEDFALESGFTGMIDDLRFYRRGLSKMEVAMLYELGTLELTLSAHYFQNSELPVPAEEKWERYNGDVELIPQTLGYDIWYWDAFLGFRPNAYFPQMVIKDASRLTWLYYNRIGVTDTLQGMSEEYYFNDEVDADEWGRMVIKPLYHYQGEGDQEVQNVALEITDRINSNANSNGTSLPLQDGEIALEVLDYGVYFFGDGGEHEKFNLIKDLNGNTYFDPDKPTMIYTHSHQYTSTKLHERDLMGTDQLQQIAQKWRAKGYNFGIFYWNQFADTYWIEGRIRRDRDATDTYMNFVKKRLEANWDGYRRGKPFDEDWFTSVKKVVTSQLGKLPTKMLDLFPTVSGVNLPTWKLEGQPFEADYNWNYKATGRVLDETFLNEITDIADLFQMYLREVREQIGSETELRIAGSGFGAQLAVEAAARMAVDGVAPDRVVMLDLLTLPDLFEDLIHAQSNKARTGEAVKTLVAEGTYVEAYTSVDNAYRSVVVLVDIVLGGYGLTKSVIKAPGTIWKAVTDGWQALGLIDGAKTTKQLLKEINQTNISKTDIEKTIALFDMRGFFEKSMSDLIPQVVISDINHWTGEEWNPATSEFPSKYYYLHSIEQEETQRAPYVRPVTEAQLVNLMAEADPGAALKDLVDHEVYLYDVPMGHNPFIWDPLLEQYLKGEPVVIDQLFQGAFEEVEFFRNEDWEVRRAPSAAISTERLLFWDERSNSLGIREPYRGRILVQVDGVETADYADDIFVEATEYAQSDWGGMASTLVVDGSNFEEVIEDCEKLFGSGSVIKGNAVIRSVPEFCLVKEACQIYTLDEELYVKLDCKSQDGTRMATQEAAPTKAYPNPFSNHIEVVMESHQAKIITVRLYDLLGRPMYTLEENGMVYEGTHKVRWDTGQVASGLYLLVIETDTGERLTTKVVKQ